ncbi:hypothetical protein MKW92_030639 [Papaver armeniacum]|nr:hypothetical protein MKW92_030639 [Papaver armeniacum]
MGATGAGKSRLAIDLASHFPIEIINADSMQVYNGLDILTNKVTIQEQKEFLITCLGNISPNVEFTSKDFRDAAIPIIDEILSRNHLPVVVGGTNFYIQALVSPFLLDDSMEDMDDVCVSSLPADKQSDYKYELENDGSTNNYNLLKELDPDATNRIHPNDYRKINQYLSLYERSGILPSKLFQAKGAEGRTGVESIIPDMIVVLYVWMFLFQFWTNTSNNECQGIRGFLSSYFSNTKTSGVRVGDQSYAEAIIPLETNLEEVSNENLKAILNSDDSQHKILLLEAIDKLKKNTKRLVRRQKRRLNRLQTIFGWDLHYVYATEAFHGDFDEAWPRQVVEPVVNIIKSFLLKDSSSIPNSEKLDPVQTQMKDARDCGLNLFVRLVEVGSFVEHMINSSNSRGNINTMRRIFIFRLG